MAVTAAAIPRKERAPEKAEKAPEEKAIKAGRIMGGAGGYRTRLSPRP